MIRVGVVHNLPRGGARRRLEEQIRHLDADVHEVCLATADPVTDDATVIPLRVRAPTVLRVARPPVRYSDLAELRRAWRRASEALTRRRVEVVYANPCHLLQGAPLALLDLGIPSLYFCDEPRRVDYDEDGDRARNPRTRHLYGPLHRAERRLDRAALAKATRLATNSRYTARRIDEAYGREAAVVPMGVPSGFTPGPPDAGPRRHLLSVGTLVPEKGHDLAIEATARASHRWPLVVTAPRPNAEEQTRLEGLARASEVELHVQVGVSDDELRAAFRSARVTLYLAEAEPFGLVSLEAQACGCPVIVSRAGGLPETLIESRTGWAVPRDPEVVAGHIDRLSDERLREEMSAAAARHGAASSWKRSAEVVASALLELREGVARR